MTLNRNDGVFDSVVPGLRGGIQALGSREDWNYTTVPQVHVSGNVNNYSRAMMLGGCSSHSAPFNPLHQLFRIQHTPYRWDGIYSGLTR